MFIFVGGLIVLAISIYLYRELKREYIREERFNRFERAGDRVVDNAINEAIDNIQTKGDHEDA